MQRCSLIALPNQSQKKRKALSSFSVLLQVALLMLLCLQGDPSALAFQRHLSISCYSRLSCVCFQPDLLGHTFWRLLDVQRGVGGTLSGSRWGICAKRAYVYMRQKRRGKICIESIICWHTCLRDKGGWD